jgi:hypothetical protein
MDHLCSTTVRQRRMLVFGQPCFLLQLPAPTPRLVHSCGEVAGRRLLLLLNRKETMLRKNLAGALTVALLGILLSSCGGGSGPAATSTLAPDPCAPQNVPAETAKVSELMREFDDASFLAQFTPTSQLGESVADLQRIRRGAEMQQVPVCLAELKRLQVEHMNAVIVTLAILMSPTPSPDLISHGIASANDLHNQYEIELARLLGITLVGPPTVTAGPSPTPLATIPPAETATPSLPFVTNPGPTTLNLRVLPALEAKTMGVLEVGATAVVLGRTPDELWYKIEVPGQPGQTAWVYAQLLQVSVSATVLPVVTAAP